MKCCITDTQVMNDAQALAADPVNAPEPAGDKRYVCRSCQGASRPVTRQTILLLLKPDLLDRVREGDYRFCPEPDCRVVYFTEDKSIIFTTHDLRERVGLKERVDPIPLCYCFGFEEADARHEIARTGTCTISQRIAALIKDKMCACTARNPSGMCCLGDVNKAIKKLLAEIVEVE